MSGENRDPRVEAEIGRSLERARKSRNLTLWQVEQETRIRSRYLRDLEREHFDVLPAVYVLGSLKTYADFLGLDGAALSGQLKARLLEPAEPDVPAQLAALGGTRGEEDEYRASPVSAVGFDHLFLGMGVILISILAIMTLVAAVAQGDRSPVSQVDQPSTSEAPSGIALAGNVQDEEDGAEAGGGSTPDNKEVRPEDGPEASRSDEKSKDEGGKEDQDAAQAASVFGDAEFVPVSPSSPTAADASTTASASAASASASPAPSNPAPATAKPDASSASPAPATAGASSGPAADNPRAAPAPPSYAPAAPLAGPEGGGGGASTRATVRGPGPISAEVDRKIDEAFEDAGLVR